MKKTLILVFLAFLSLPVATSAHPGNTDSSGCHTCRTNCASWGLSYGEYHCHNSKTISQPITPSCPLNSSYDYSSKTCKCYSGYVANSNGAGCISNDQWCKNEYGYNAKSDYSGSCECSYGYVLGKDSIGRTQCISGNQSCENQYGYHASYDSLSSKCECDRGYLFGKKSFGDIQCISGDDWCEDEYGIHAGYDSLSEKCECDYGYKFSGDKCVKEETSGSYSNIDYTALLQNLQSSSGKCGVNSHSTTDKKCLCDTGYVWENSADESNLDCVKQTCSDSYILIGGVCITHTKNCENSFGPNVTGVKGDSDNSSCTCNAGYQWDSNKTKCEKIPEQEVLGVKINNSNEFVEEEKGKISKIDGALSNRLKGRILLQVENKGEAWYVSPKDGKKYYMADGQEAYTIMRRLGVGITNKDLEKIKADKNFAKKHSGKIFLQVEANGEAYYIDINGVSHYLKDGESAYEAMRSLGLGIANNDLRKIDINTIQ